MYGRKRRDTLERRKGEEDPKQMLETRARTKNKKQFRLSEQKGVKEEDAGKKEKRKRVCRRRRRGTLARR